MSFDWSKYSGGVDWLQSRTIFLTKHGSHAYGTNIETSDVDYKGICIAPRNYYLGNLHRFEQADKGFEDDTVIYDVRKFFQLAVECNPNIIEVLHTDPEDWIWPEYRNDSPHFEKIYDNREMFLSKLAKFRFSGYAFAQLKRIKTHRHWLLNPPKGQPARGEFKLPEEPTLDRDQLNSISSEVDKLQDKLGGEGFTRDRVAERDPELVTKVVKKHNLSANLIETILNERRFRAAMANWHQYLKWKEGRNEKRAALEKQFGYDTKHAMHLVRLMRMATEILDGKGVIVKRPDAKELLEIRDGLWTFDELIEWSQDMEERLADKYAASTLRHSPDREAVDKLLIEVIEGYPR